MKIIFLIAVLTTLLSCGRKSGWTKERAYEKCMNEAIEMPSLDSLIERKNIYKFCNCLSEKAVSKYKTEEESEKDSEGFSLLITFCLEQVR
jgi:hypothetical protein